MAKKVYVISLILAIAALAVFDTKMLLFSKKPAATAPSRVEGLLPIVRLVRDGHTYCTGVVIDKTTIVTASHCVSIMSMFMQEVNRDPIEIRAVDNVPRGTAGKVTAVLSQLDRAILKGDFHIFAPAPYISDVGESVSHRTKGEKFVSCGYPLGGRLFCTSTTYVQNEGFMLGVHGVLIPGMSGGPTMTLDGTVIAINIAVEGNMAILSPIYNVDDEKEDK